MKNSFCLRLFIVLSCLFYSSVSLFAQHTVRGKVTDEKGAPIAGATITIVKTRVATSTDEQGSFQFTSLADQQGKLLVTNVGYHDRAVAYTSGEELTIVLIQSIAEAEPLVVTGVFDKRKRMEASVAISTINTKTISRIAPVSATDLLKYVPGLYVNSSLGEIRNTVYSRGVSVGSNDGASGYYYVSMQEDGLPVINITCSNFGPDYFLRSDATLGRLEAVRGGTASILGNNAPGGIFNYISKEGGDKTTGEVITKYGLEGNGKNNFYRTDINVGGPMGNNWFWNAGGFYRYDQGARYPGYPMNNGGQFRGNLVKKYSTGSLKFYAKCLDDHNGWYEFTPSTSFTNPKPVAGFSGNSAVLAPSIQQNFTINQTGQGGTYNNRNLVHSIDRSAGFNWEQRFGKDWTFNNAMRYSDVSAIWNTNSSVYPIALNDINLYSRMNTVGVPGTYHYKDLNTGQDLATVSTTDGQTFNVTSSNLPGQNVLPNSLFYEPLLFISNKAKEYVDQFALSKRLKNMSFTLGGFYGHTTFDRLNGRIGVALGTVEPSPRLVGITLTNPDGSTSQVTNSNGVMTVNRVGQIVSHVTQSQLAFFLGHNWQITPALNLDWGIRYETDKVQGYNSPSVANNNPNGGIDGNKLTLYDNAYATTPNTFSFSRTVNTLSYSAGLNYKINDRLSVYGRYSEGNKAPDLDLYINATSAFLAQTLDPQAQKIKEAELGIKAKTGSNLNR